MTERQEKNFFVFFVGWREGISFKFRLMFRACNLEVDLPVSLESFKGFFFKRCFCSILFLFRWRNFSSRFSFARPVLLFRTLLVVPKTAFYGSVAAKVARKKIEGEFCFLFSFYFHAGKKGGRGEMLCSFFLPAEIAAKCRFFWRDFFHGIFFSAGWDIFPTPFA